MGSSFLGFLGIKFSIYLPFSHLLNNFLPEGRETDPRRRRPKPKMTFSSYFLRGLLNLKLPQWQAS
jgi:hypothetical protein